MRYSASDRTCGEMEMCKVVAAVNHMERRERELMGGNLECFECNKLSAQLHRPPREE